MSRPSSTAPPSRRAKSRWNERIAAHLRDAGDDRGGLAETWIAQGGITERRRVETAGRSRRG